MRRSAAAGRSTEQVGPFLATFSAGSTNPYLNYAIPDDGASPSPADVADLVSAYRRRDLSPRVEFLVDTAPAAEAALLDAGWSVERQMTKQEDRKSATMYLPSPR